MFTSFAFWTALLLAFAGMRLLPAGAERSRAALLAAAGLAGAIFVLELPTAVLALLFVSIAWIQLGLSRVAEGAHERPFAIGLAIFAPVLLLWVLGKQSVAAESASFGWLYFAGFSFFLVKAWTLIKDRLDGRVDAVPPATTLAYFLHLPTYLSGPMHYYGEFRETLREPEPPDAEGWVDVALRFTWGLVKVQVLAPLLTMQSLTELQQGGSLEVAEVAVGCLAYSFVLYFDFSGYSDMAIATSRALGIRTPENFNNPYLATNIRDFWQRWHISFSRVLTAYIFLPLTRALGRPLAGRRKTITALGYLATFGFCGYWHGPTLNFVAWGLYHALGLIVHDLYRQRVMARRRAAGVLAKPGGPSLPVRVASTAGTFVYVSFGWLFFALPLSRVFAWAG